MSLSEIYNRVWPENDDEFIKLSDADQEAFGRLAARGFMEKLAELSTPEIEKDSKAKAIASGAKKARILKALLTGGAVGGGAAAGHSVGRKQERQENVKAVRSYLSYLRQRGHLR